MDKIAIAVHGGAGPDSEFIKKHKKEYKLGLKEAVTAAYNILASEGNALDAVEAAVRTLEDNPFFNAGKGSALNESGEVEMCAAIMDGQNLESGGVAIIRNVKNPVTLAKSILKDTNYKYIGAEGAMKYAKSIKSDLRTFSYFITPHQREAYEKKHKEVCGPNEKQLINQINKKYHGTVGAVALDKHGNIAAATSTGGTDYCKEGRIADSGMIGVGTYANNKTCAISCTGDGEYIMRGVIAHSVSALMKYKNKPLTEACKEVVHVENKNIEGDLGLIAVDTQGNIAMEFNSERMHRAWKIGNEDVIIKIYKD